MDDAREAVGGETTIAGASRRRTWRIVVTDHDVSIDTWSRAGQWMRAALHGVLVIALCAVLWPVVAGDPPGDGALVLVAVAAFTLLVGPAVLAVAFGRETAVVTATALRLERSEVVRRVVRTLELGPETDVGVARGAADVRGGRIDISGHGRGIRVGAWLPASVARTAAAAVRRLVRPPRQRRSPDGVVWPVASERTECGGREIALPVLLPDVIAPRDGVLWVEHGENGESAPPTLISAELGSKAIVGVVAVSLALGVGVFLALLAAVVALLIVLAPGGVRDSRRRRRLRAVERAHPDEPWRWTRVWDGPVAGRCGGFEALGRGVAYASLCGGAARPCGEIVIEFALDDRLVDVLGIDFVLRRLQVHRSGEVRRVAVTHLGRRVLPGSGPLLRPGASVLVPFRFAEPAPGTCLAPRGSAMWELVADLHTATGDFALRFPLPLFDEAPVSVR